MNSNAASMNKKNQAGGTDNNNNNKTGVVIPLRKVQDVNAIESFAADGDDCHKNHHSLPEFAPFHLKKNHQSSREGKSAAFVRYLYKYGHAMLTFGLVIALAIVLALLRDAKTSQSAVMSSATSQDVTLSDNSKVPWLPLPDPSQRLSSIAFGSCMKEEMPQPFWDTLVNMAPNITILAGDQVYMQGVESCDDAKCKRLKRAYEQLERHPSFQGAKRHLPMIAMPDDHDYGQNDCGNSNPYKDIAKQHFLDWMDVPSSDERRHRENEGLYTSYEFGTDNERLQIILLDTRYSRSSFIYDEDLWGYKPYPEDQQGKHMLSHTQWQWFEQVLQRPANLRLIVSTQQVLAKGVWGFESWSLIPPERRRLQQVLHKYCMDDALGDKRSLPVLLSGDRHIGAVYNDPDLDPDLLEVTASSWTHTIPNGWDPDGIRCTSKNADECIEEDVARVGDWVGVNHFGLVTVNWHKRTVDLSLIRAETSNAYYMKQKWSKNTDAGETLRTLTLAIP